MQSTNLTGRDLDAAIAEKLFGKQCEYSKFADEWFQDGSWNVPYYRESWNDMRLVVEEMQAKGWSHELRRRLSGRPEAIFTTDDCEVSAVGGDMPEAVARAALKALEVVNGK